MIYQALKYTSALSVLVPFIAAVSRERAFNKALKALYLLLAISLVTELYCFLHFLYSSSTIPIFFMFTIAEGLILLYIFSEILESPKIKAQLRYIAMAYAFLALATALLGWTHEILNGTEGILMIILSAFYFYRTLNQQTAYVSLRANYFIWINSGIFIYFGVNLFLFAFENTVRYSDPHIRNLTWSIHLFTNIFYNMIVAIGICKRELK